MNYKQNTILVIGTLFNKISNKCLFNLFNYT